METEMLLIQQRIQDLAFSPAFKGMAVLNGYNTMDEMLSFSLSFLLSCDGFTPPVMQELTAWLIEHDLLQRLKQE